MIPPPAGTTEAILLHPAGVASERAIRFLSLLGIETVLLTAGEIIAPAAATRSRCLVLSGPDAILLADLARQRSIPPGNAIASYAAALFHSIDPQSAALKAVADLMGGVQLSAVGFQTETGDYRVSARHPDECGPLSGLAHGPCNETVDWGLAIGASDGIVEKLIEINGHGLLTRLFLRDQQVLIAATTEILDLAEPVRENIDFRPCFSRVAPLLVALRSVFQGACWTPRGCYANITIDDPPLWPRYGLLDQQRLAAIVARLGCAATIGMIPWNFRRSRQTMADMFARQAPRLGICYHGCDHTGDEFGRPDETAMGDLFALAKQRMRRHQELTGLECQPVMIFPQGVFSVEAMSALKTAGCLAVVNTESQDKLGRMRVTVGDLMRPALMVYGALPLFVRRRPSDGPVNLAMDMLLGRPSLIVTHHEFYKDGFVAFEALVRMISALDRNLIWDSLQNIARTCSLVRGGTTGKASSMIFTREAVLPACPMERIVSKELGEDEPPPSVLVDGITVKTATVNGHFLRFVTPARIGTSIQVHLVPAAAQPSPVRSRQAIPLRLKVAARRYASEFRDNHLTKSAVLRRYANSLASLMRKR